MRLFYNDQSRQNYYSFLMLNFYPILLLEYFQMSVSGRRITNCWWPVQPLWHRDPDDFVCTRRIHEKSQYSSKIIAGAKGTKTQGRLRPPSSRHLAPVTSIRSFTRCRQAPSITPVADWEPLAKITIIAKIGRLVEQISGTDLHRFYVPRWWSCFRVALRRIPPAIKPAFP